jgi:hypothetical protein
MTDEEYKAKYYKEWRPQIECDWCGTKRPEKIEKCPKCGKKEPVDNYSLMKKKHTLY